MFLQPLIKPFLVNLFLLSSFRGQGDRGSTAIHSTTFQSEPDSPGDRKSPYMFIHVPDYLLALPGFFKVSPFEAAVKAYQQFWAKRA